MRNTGKFFNGSSRPTISAHHAAVRQMRCCVTRRYPVTLHHVHGGSVTEEYPQLMRGKAQKTSDWLVIPVVAELHVGRHGIDGAMTVQDWEAAFGRQVDHLREVSEHVGYDVIGFAMEELR